MGLPDSLAYVAAFLFVLWDTFKMWIKVRMSTTGREQVKASRMAAYRRLNIEFHDEDQQLESYITWAAIMARTKTMFQRFRSHPVKLGGDAYNGPTYRLDGTKARILDFQSKGRPLVLNFGSCT